MELLEVLADEALVRDDRGAGFRAVGWASISGARLFIRSLYSVYVLGEARGARPLASLFAAPLAEQVPVGPADVVALPYCSGTTGFCKGVMLTHRNLVANGAPTLAVARIMPVESGPGLWDDGAVPGVALHATRRVQAQVGGGPRPEHADPDHRPGARGGSCDR